MYRRPSRGLRDAGTTSMPGSTAAYSPTLTPPAVLVDRVGSGTLKDVQTAPGCAVEREGRAAVAFARVVTFEGVGQDRIEEMRRDMEGDQPPEGLPAKELIVLHDADAERSVVVVFFDTEDDYRQGDATLNAMPAGDTPGRRVSVEKYEVPIRMSV
jgi:hypothetical protein